MLWILLHSTHHLMEARQLTQSQNVSICNCWPTHCDLLTIIQWTIELDLSKWRLSWSYLQTKLCTLWYKWCASDSNWNLVLNIFSGKTNKSSLYQNKVHGKQNQEGSSWMSPSISGHSTTVLSSLLWVTGLCCQPGLSHGDQDYSCCDFKLIYNILLFTPIFSKICLMHALYTIWIDTLIVVSLCVPLKCSIYVK